MQDTDYIGRSKVKDLLVLCDMYETLPDFISSLERLYDNYPRRDIITLLDRISKGEKPMFTPSGVQRFATKFKKQLESMNEHSSVEEFLVRNVDENGSLGRYSSLRSYDMYMTAHRDQMFRIKGILEKVDNLGIQDIVLDQNEKFTNKKYYMDKSMLWNPSFYYVNGIEIVPNYDATLIKYKTKESPYEIKLGGYDNSFVPIMKSTITVTDLLFDPSLLPEEINSSIVYDFIMKKRAEKEATCQQLTSAVNLNIATQDLNAQLQKLEKVVEGIQSQGPGKNIPMVNALFALREAALNLTTSSSAYQRQLTEQTEITPELIHSESERYEKTHRRRVAVRNSKKENH